MPDRDGEIDAAATWRAKVEAEVEQAESLLSQDSRLSTPPAFSAVLVVKGRPSDADVAAGRVLSGDDGDAIRKALAALGIEGEPFCAASRPAHEADASPDAVARRLRLLAEAVEAEAVLALDDVAAQDVARAFGLEALQPGVPVEVLGRTVLATDDFSAALADEASKRVVWRQLKTLVSS